MARRYAEAVIITAMRQTPAFSCVGFTPHAHHRSRHDAAEYIVNFTVRPEMIAILTSAVDKTKRALSAPIKTPSWRPHAIVSTR